MTWNDFVSSLPIAMIAAGVIALGVCIFIAVRYRTKCKSPTYPLSEFTKLDLTGRTDLYIGKTVTRVRVQSDNNRK